MKKIIFTCLVFITSLCHSQTKEYDIHILLNDTLNTRILETKKDSIYQIFTFKDQLKCQYKTIVFREGKLQSKIEITGRADRLTLLMTYTNFNDNNSPVLLKRNKVKNILRYPKSFKGARLGDIYNLLKNAKHTYIIETDAIYGYYVLKEVKLIEY